MGYLFPPPSKPDYPRPNFNVMLLNSAGLPRNPLYFNILFLVSFCFFKYHKNELLKLCHFAFKLSNKWRHGFLCFALFLFSFSRLSHNIGFPLYYEISIRVVDVLHTGPPDISTTPSSSLPCSSLSVIVQPSHNLTDFV